MSQWLAYAIQGLADSTNRLSDRLDATWEPPAPPPAKSKAIKPKPKKQIKTPATHNKPIPEVAKVTEYLRELTINEPIVKPNGPVNYKEQRSRSMFPYSNCFGEPFQKERSYSYTYYNSPHHGLPNYDYPTNDLTNFHSPFDNDKKFVIYSPPVDKTPHIYSRSKNNKNSLNKLSTPKLDIMTEKIRDIVESVVIYSRDQNLSKSSFVQTLLASLGNYLNETPFYVLIISSKLLKFATSGNGGDRFQFNNELFDELVKWCSYNGKSSMKYRIKVFTSGLAELDSNDNGFEKWGFSNGIRTGLDLEKVQWIDKSVKETPFYGLAENNSNESYKIETNKRLDKHLTKIDVFYSKHIHGLKFTFRDGDSELFGNCKTGALSSFLISRSDSLIGVKLTCGRKLNSIQFRTSSGSYSGYFGRYNYGHEHDICFNSPLRKVQGKVFDSSIECIQFCW